MAGFEFGTGILEPFVGRRQVVGRRQAAIGNSTFEAERLAAKIEQVVWHATAAAVKDLRVEVENGEVILTGRCRTYYTKQIAQHAAMAEADAWSVVNQIHVT